MKEFKSGDPVYSDYGQEAEYVAKISDGHIVRPIVEACSGDGEKSYWHICEPTTWRHVFESAPVEKYNERLQALHAEIEAATVKRNSIQREAIDAEKDLAAKRREWAKMPTTEYLDDYLAGKITHFAKFSTYDPKIVAFGDEIYADSDERRSGTMRLLCLYGSIGKHGRDMKWFLHSYSDGSGGRSHVQPCRSEEEALAAIQAYLAKELVEIQKSSNKYGAMQLAKSCKKFGVTVPDDVAAEAAKQKEADKENAKKSAQKAFDDAVIRMKALGMPIESLLNAGGTA